MSIYDIDFGSSLHYRTQMTRYPKVWSNGGPASTMPNQQ